ncbi:serine hydrolase domain-containing protein [Amycolatopsis sp. NPDC059027]|uniref:serine hydrolase domain-containing protein n=1 Tax=Amycolatopsis sp. NPDC059027 TaxID=3346709 RepID=UPI00366E62E7
MSGAERSSERAGASAREVLDLIDARGSVAQICVLHKGKVVLDHAFGCAADTSFLLFSAGKPLVAMLVHLLAERGQLALDDPMARYWPEFGQRGKDAVTIRQALQHRSGVPYARSVHGDALVATNWRRSVQALERAHPTWRPGEVPAYHVLSYGFLLGELIRRVTGTEVREVMRSELLDPLGLSGTHLGTPPSLWAQHIPVTSRGFDGRLRGLVFNRRSVREAVIPAATVSSTARDLARFYQLLLSGGELDGVRVFASATIAGARQPSSDGEVDRVLRLPIRWSQAFQLGGPDATRPRPMGRRSGWKTFGHNGSHCCLAWADPERQLVFAYLTNRLPSVREGSRHQTEVSDAVLAAFG